MDWVERRCGDQLRCKISYLIYREDWITYIQVYTNTIPLSIVQRRAPVLIQALSKLHYIFSYRMKLTLMAISWWALIALPSNSSTLSFSESVQNLHIFSNNCVIYNRIDTVEKIDRNSNTHRKGREISLFDQEGEVIYTVEYELKSTQLIFRHCW